MTAFRNHAQRSIEALNQAFRGIPQEQVRFHLCWASWHRPHVTDLPREDFVDIVLKVNAQAIAWAEFEAMAEGARLASEQLWDLMTQGGRIV